MSTELARKIASGIATLSGAPYYCGEAELAEAVDRLMAEHFSAAPRRAHEFWLHLSGDSREDVVYALEELCSRIHRGELTISVCGGATHGWIALYAHTNKSHDTWAAELEAYLEREKARRLSAEPAKPGGA